MCIQFVWDSSFVLFFCFLSSHLYRDYKLGEKNCAHEGFYVGHIQESENITHSQANIQAECADYIS